MVKMEFLKEIRQKLTLSNGKFSYLMARPKTQEGLRKFFEEKLLQEQNITFQCPLCMETKPCAIKVQHLKLCLSEFQFAFEERWSPAEEYPMKKRSTWIDEDESPGKKRRLVETETIEEEECEDVTPVIEESRAGLSSTCHFVSLCGKKKKDGSFRSRINQDDILIKIGGATTKLCKMSHFKSKKEASDLKNLLTRLAAESGNKSNSCDWNKTCKKCGNDSHQILVHSRIIEAKEGYSFCSVSCVLSWGSTEKDYSWKKQVREWKSTQVSSCHKA